MRTSPSDHPGGAHRRAGAQRWDVDQGSGGPARDPAWTLPPRDRSIRISDVVSVIRTAIPTAWGAVIVWLVGLSLLPAELVAQAEGFAVVLTAVAIALFYALVRWQECQPWSPLWLSRLLLGSAKAPSYTTGRHAREF
jgi:hypothetical protein